VTRELILRRRRIGGAELDLIRGLIVAEGPQGRSHLSNRLCQIWDWRQANGRFRQIACRDLLRQLEARGLIQLPPPLAAARRPGYRNRVRTLAGLDSSPVRGSLASLRDQLNLVRVQGAESLQLFNGLIGTYHYLGYQQPTGAQLKYLVYAQPRPIACLSWGPAAFKLAARDRFIGWSVSQRQARLPWVVNQDRFLILPWVQVPRLASWLLSQCLRRVPTDWQEVYRQEVVLAETFIEAERFAGSSYAAANWLCVGRTQGRGRNDRLHRVRGPRKTIWLYPLREDFRQVLCAPGL